MQGNNFGKDLAVVKTVVAPLEVRQILANAAEQVGEIFQASRVVVLPPANNLCHDFNPVEWTSDSPDPTKDSSSLIIAEEISNLIAAQIQSGQGKPLVIKDAVFSPLLLEVRDDLTWLSIRSILAYGFYIEGVHWGTIIAYQSKAEHQWSEKEIDFIVDLTCFMGLTIRQIVSHQPNISSPAYLKQLLESIKTPFAWFNNSGQVQAINSEFRSICGIEPKEVESINLIGLIELIVHPDDKDKTIRAYDQSFRLGISDTPLEYRIVNRRTKKTIWILATLSAVMDESGVCHGYQGTFSNISQLKLLGRAEARDSERYRRLVENSDAIIFHADRKHILSFISKRALDFFGLPPEEFVGQEKFRWYELAQPEDRERISRLLSESEESPQPIEEEISVINHITGQLRWLLIRLVPIFDEHSQLIGWDGFGLDITFRREAQAALEQQSKKIKALYTVSAAIRGYVDPAKIAARGLSALCDAIHADAALCYLYSQRESRDLQLIAHHGFSAHFSERFDSLSGVPSLSSYVAEHGQPMIVPDVKNEPRASKWLYEEEGIKSALLIPIQVEEEILGTIDLLSRKSVQFDSSDVMLIASAANQIGLAARQANLFAAYRTQTKNLAALYRISHELSRHSSLTELFQNAFSIIRDELGLKRLWLGLLNETGNRIIGQAAYGPGWKRGLVQINVEITGPDNPIAAVIANRQPVIIDEPDNVLREFGFRKVFSRLGIHSLVMVPIISAGQVLGVLAVQPLSDEVRLDARRTTLLSSLANEIGAAVVAKRLEERIAEGDKMRSSGLLAAGIAHNFNNLLQAILGQASLIEMQKDSPEAVEKASQLIVDAALKGSTLVKQLMSFAHLEEPHREVFDMNSFVEMNLENFKRLLKDNQKLRVKLDASVPKVLADPHQLIRVISAILINANEAMKEGGNIDLFTNYCVVSELRPQFEVPFGEYVRIGIRDHGIGMDSETRKRCFEPFFTTKERDDSSGLGFTGAGLGLASAFALVRKNGGRIVVDSRPGHGALFTIYVKVAKEISKDVGQSRSLSSEVEIEDSQASLLMDETTPRNKQDLPDNKK